MREEYEKNRLKQVSRMRAWLEYAIGIFFVCVGVIIFFNERFNIPVTGRLSPGTIKTLGIIVIVYGGWRIYSGYKKNIVK